MKESEEPITAPATAAPRRFQFVGLWAAICVTPPLLQAFLLGDAAGSMDGIVFESPIALFTIVVIAASLCIATSSVIILRALRTATPELAIMGLFFMSVSALPFVHGFTTPGAIYDENTTTMATALWAIPLGLALASPNFLPSGLRRRFLKACWKPWLGVGLGCIALLAIVSIIEPNIFPSYQSGGRLEKVVATVSLAGVISLSYRQVRLAQIARNRGPLVIAAGYALIAGSAVMWFGASAYSLGFWAAHALDICGVTAGTIGILVVYRKADNVRDALDPILVSDPLSALELGLEPTIHLYLADLEAKDVVTRDHVVRTAELSLLVGEEMGFSGDHLRHISLVGLLHDVGKLDIPDAILTKPNKLTNEEFELVKRHPVDGATRVLASAILAPLGPGIRSHHERIDGRGYPDRLVDTEIPIEARIVAACDAYDAMANTRQYRTGMGRDKAISILREHQGAQWDAEVVDALIRVVRHRPLDETPSVLSGVGRVGCDCLPASATSEPHEVAVPS